MEILGVGPSELLFIVIIALIILGPKDMQKAGKMIGKWLRSIVTSDGWKIFQQTSRELRTLPNRLMREANDELDQVNRDIKNASSPAPARPANPNIPSRSQPMTSPPPAFPENRIAPPKAESAPEQPDKEENA
jgi:sec-independent protein translocase protein TatB